MIGPGLVWFNRLRTDIEMVRLNRRPIDGEEPPCTPPPVLKTPPLPRRSPPSPPPGPGDDAARSRGGPNSSVLANRKLTVMEPGPRPKLRGRIFSSGVGLGSSKPYLVRIRP